VTKHQPPTNDVDDGDERKDDRSSLDRLAEFTKKIVHVPKSEIDERESRKQKSRHKQPAVE
jgi:hypothetical protein